MDIVTTIDGRANKRTWDANYEFSVNDARIVYRDEEALVEIIVGDGRAQIVRRGDYGLSMTLEEGKETPVRLEIGGNVGEITAKTKRLGYSTTDTSCMIQIRYTLVFSEQEGQEISLRLHAKRK